MIKNCKYCDSSDLVLKLRCVGESFETAKQVALMCNNCSKWLKWCPKEERNFYIKKEFSTADKLLYIIDYYHIEETIDNLYKN